MFCKNCGAEMHENAVACLSCGFAKGKGYRFCASCGREINPGAVICTACGSAIKDEAAENAEAKSKLIALLLTFFLGGWGIHDFYLGYNKYGVIKIILFFFTFGVGSSIWALVDPIRLLTGSLHTDANGIELKKDF